MAKDTFRVVTRGTDGTLHIRDYNKPEALQKQHTQIGIDDCSTDLGLRALPVFRGLIGPMPEGKNIIRYESPDVFESLTKEWTVAKTGLRPQEDVQRTGHRAAVAAHRAAENSESQPRGRTSRSARGRLRATTDRRRGFEKSSGLRPLGGASRPR